MYVRGIQLSDVFGKSTKHWHRLTPGLVNALIKLHTAIRVHDRNAIDIHHELDLTTTESMNWTKLRLHRLVAKVKVDGHVQRGQWLLTDRGARFLRGELAVPARVQTLNNHVVDHDPEHVDVTDVMGSVPYFEDIEDIEDIESEAQPLTLGQASLL